MRLRLRASSGLATPTRGGWRPRIRGLSRSSPSLSRLRARTAAATRSRARLAVGMTSTIAPYYSDGQITLYEAQTPVRCPVRKPTSADRAELGAAPKGTPYPHAPFLTVQDESVEVHYVLSNVDSVSHNVWLLIDPWNEFVRWKPGVTVVSDEETIPNNGYDKEYVLPARCRASRARSPRTTSRRSRPSSPRSQTFLASPQGKQTASAMTRQQPRSDAGLQQHLRLPEPLELDAARPLLHAVDPAVVAGLTGFDLGIRMEADARGGGGAGNVAVEITMDVQDLNGDRFVPQDTTDAEMGMPAKTLSPPSAARSESQAAGLARRAAMRA